MRFDHRKLLDGIRSVSGETVMAGGTTAGEISGKGFSTGSVVIMAFQSDALDFQAGVGRCMSREEYACSVSMLDDLRRKRSYERALSLLVFPDGMGGDENRSLAGIHSVLGTDFEIAGGCLADDERFERTFQYCNGNVYSDSITGLMVFSAGGFSTGIGMGSGFESIGNSFQCTSAEGRVVREFDGISALKLYKDFLGPERSSRLPGICLEYPFGIIEDTAAGCGEPFFRLRCGLSVDHEKGSITLAASIPEGSVLTLTSASRGDIIRGAQKAALQAKQSLGDAEPLAAIMFSCVGRKLVLGNRIKDEVAAVRSCIGEDVPLAGFYTYGEIGPFDKTRKDLAASRFHNETVVLWVLGKTAD
jgi:hypothetical protein